MKPLSNRLSLPARYPSASLMPVIDATTSNELADLCRSAALGFLANAHDWDKRKLAEWLEQSYRPVVVGASKRSPRRLTLAYGTPSTPPPSPSIHPGMLAHVLAVAHAEVLRRLRELADAPSSLEAGRAFISSNVVTRCIDEMGVPGWAPVAHRPSHLADRVMSLFAADFLARPWDYEYDLAICSECETVSFAEVSCCRARSGTQRVAERVGSSIAKAS